MVLIMSVRGAVILDLCVLRTVSTSEVGDAGYGMA